VRLCARCVLPDTRPGIDLDADGVCTACRGHDLKTTGTIDWTARAEAFDRLIDETRARTTGFDCIVPVSGGKDSWYQAIRCRELGLRVLGVTWRTPGRTELGQRNLDALIDRVGIDHVDWSIDPDVERRFMVAAYERKGATAIPMHMALFAIPTRLAVQLRIPLVVWGENPQLEFGGRTEDQLLTELDADWIRNNGVTNGTVVDDWIGAEGLSAADLAPYRLPDVGADDFVPRSVFLGAFFPWDSRHNAAVAQARGFEPAPAAATGEWRFADVDDRFISLHHFLKWFKFGMTRAFDNLSVDIRHGRITREDALARLADLGPQVPEDDIAAFCEFVGRPTEWFWDVAERWRNLELWTRDGDRWVIPDFPVPGWRW
jgi:N-acetyl sugar amidotransferase